MICLSIARFDFQAIMEFAAKADAMELRLELLDELSPEQMVTLTRTGCHWVATCRAGELTDEERFVRLAQAMASGATFVDVEYEADRNYRDALIRNARNFSCSVIISYHNMTETPDEKTLEQIIRNAFNWGADYVKIATMVREEEDNRRLIGLYQKHNQLIAFGMGEKGRSSRIDAAPLSPLTYVAPDAEHRTAPGQLTFQEALDLHLDDAGDEE